MTVLMGYLPFHKSGSVPETEMKAALATFLKTTWVERRFQEKLCKNHVRGQRTTVVLQSLEQSQYFELTNARQNLIEENCFGGKNESKEARSFASENNRLATHLPSTTTPAKLLRRTSGTHHQTICSTQTTILHQKGNGHPLTTQGSWLVVGAPSASRKLPAVEGPGSSETSGVQTAARPVRRALFSPLSFRHDNCKLWILDSLLRSADWC